MQMQFVGNCSLWKGLAVLRGLSPVGNHTLGIGDEYEEEGAAETMN